MAKRGESKMEQKFPFPKISKFVLALLLLMSPLMISVQPAFATEYSDINDIFEFEGVEQANELDEIFELGEIRDLIPTSGFVTEPIIAAGGRHNVALKSDGSVWVWGNNQLGQLGDGTRNTHLVPVQVQNLRNMVSVSAGMNHTVALRDDGTVWAWGENFSNQLGSGEGGYVRSIPDQVQNINNVVSIATGSTHTVALKDDGTVWSWGFHGTSHSGLIHQVQNLSNVTAVAAGGRHSVALKSDGTVWAWGANLSGQLGDGTTSPHQYFPVQVQNLNNIISIAAGQGHSVALKSDGTVWTWGGNPCGQLGDGTTSPYQYLPVQVQNLNNIAAIAAGSTHTVALRNDGTVWAWGINGSCILDGTVYRYQHTPIQLENLSNIVSISAGWSHTIALRSDETVWAWGYNWAGQLGDSTTIDRFTPMRVLGPNGVGYLNLGESAPLIDPIANYFAESSYTYNHALATRAAVLSSLADNQEALESELIENWGVPANNIHSAGDPLSTLDVHRVHYTFATRQIERNGDTYNLIFVIVRGTAGLEWLISIQVIQFLRMANL